MQKTAVCLLRGDDLGDEETGAAGRALLKLLRTGDDLPGRIIRPDDIPHSVKELLGVWDYEIFIFLEDTVFITCNGLNALGQIISEKRIFEVLAPVSNEGSTPQQRHAPPFLYQTLSAFQWASDSIYSAAGHAVEEADTADSFCFAVRRETLGSLPEDTTIEALPHFMNERKFRCGIAKGVYVHRYGNVYESGREDLLAHVPADAKEILDVGCARGLFGELLKKRQECRVTGIDMDKQLLEYAEKRIDLAIHGEIEEEIAGGGLKKYDAIVCGDVIEHLRDPWRVVRMLANHLNRNGLFIASTPNICNWAVIHELLAGEWNYVPFSILSGAHIRFFTRSTFTDLFRDAGYGIRGVHLNSMGTPPKGEEFIEKLMKKMPWIEREELTASEITLVAER